MGNSFFLCFFIISIHLFRRGGWGAKTPENTSDNPNWLTGCLGVKCTISRWRFYRLAFIFVTIIATLCDVVTGRKFNACWQPWWRHLSQWLCRRWLIFFLEYLKKNKGKCSCYFQWCKYHGDVFSWVISSVCMVEDKQSSYLTFDLWTFWNLEGFTHLTRLKIRTFRL